MPEFPRRMGRYELVSELGRGGWGRVYRADLLGPAGFRKEVALKVALRASASESANEALFDEARVGARLHHPNVVGVYDVGVVDDAVFIAMELIDGCSAAALSASVGPLEPEVVVAIGLQLCAGLAAAHGLNDDGVVHGDIKPANILIGRDGGARIADFGLASRVGVEAQLVSGSLGYIAPECLEDLVPDTRADLFALGVTLAELALGEPLFPRDGAAQYAFALVAPQEAPALDRLPGPLRPVIVRCLARARAERYQDVGDVAAALRACGVDPAAPEEIADLVERATDSPAEAPWDLPSTAEIPFAGLEGRFLGRGVEIAEIAALLQARRLVTLTGPGGVGKTRTATQAAAAAANSEFAVTILFCDLAEIRDRAGVVRVVAATLGLQGKTDDPETELGEALARADDLLLILDNAEQVAAPLAAALEDWLPRTRARFLVTSRERLHVDGEDVVALGPLDAETAAALYRDRARVPAPPADVAALVDALDGLPLAIEMAAAMASELPPAELRERVAEDPSWLSDPLPGRPARHRSIDATISWSWELLTPWECAALTQLAVFRRGFTIEGAEAVLDLDAWPEAPWAMFVIEALLSRSLIRPTVHRGPPRFALYAVVREWVARKQSPAEALATRERHAEYLAGFGAPGAAVRTRTLAGRDLHRRLLDEREDLDAAVSMALTSFPEHLVNLTVAFALACGIEGPYARGLAVLRAALQRLDAIGPDDAGRLRMLQRYAFLLVRSGLPGQLPAIARQERALAEALGDRAGLARALDHLATSHTMQGRPAQALPVLQEAVEIAAALGDQQLQGAITSNIAVAEYALGNVDRFASLSATALDLARQSGDVVGEGVALSNLGAARAQQGELEAAETLFRRALAVQRLKGHRGDVALAELNLALVHAQDGCPSARLEEQIGLLDDVERTYRRLGDRPLQGLARAFRGLAGLRLGRGAHHEELVHQGRELLRQSGAASLDQVFVRDWALHLYRSGDIDRAQALASEAAEEATKQGDKLSLAELESILGLIATKRDDRGEAERRLRAAERLLDLAGAAPTSAARHRAQELRRALA